MGGSKGTEASSDDCIKVFIRQRPLGGGSGEHEEVSRCVSNATETTLSLAGKEERKFTFDGIKGEDSTQEEMFTMVGRGVVDNCIQGYNGTIFAYGQTGSGKTYTMAGLLDDNGNMVREKRGLMPRCFEQIFSEINRKQQQHGDNVKYLVNCSFLEIYNEKIFDLLDAGSVGLQIREDVKSGVTVRDLTELPCNNAHEACEVLKVGNRNRRVASTSMNRESSRSHAVFQLSIKSLTVSADVTNVKEAKLNLIDLAGSERQRDTKADGSRLKEAGSINKSLSALGNVIMSLVDIANGKHRHVAYRDSKLTFLLRDSLGGNTKTYMVANVSPASRCFGETLSTLQFAQRAKMIKNRAIINEDVSGCVASLQDEIKKLKMQLAQGVGAISSDAPVTTSTSTADDGKLLMAAISTRKMAEQEKDVLRKELILVRQLLAKKEQALQSTKMIIRFRDAALSKMNKKKDASDENSIAQDVNDKIKALEDEIKTQKGLVANHPEVTRFAVQNLQLREEINQFKASYPEAEKDNALLAQSREYTMLLEARLKSGKENGFLDGDAESSGVPGAIPATPVARRTRSKALFGINSPMPETPRAKKSRELELENFKMQKEFESTVNALKETSQNDQKVTEEVIKAARNRELELCGERDGAVARLNELENTLKVLTVRHTMEISRLQDEQMQRLDKFGSDATLKETQKFQAKLDMINSEVNAMKKENASLKREKETFAEIKSDLITEVATAESQLKSMINQAEESYSELEEFKQSNRNTIVTKDAEASKLTSLLEEAKAKLGETEDQLVAMTEQESQLKAEFETLSQKMDAAKQDFDSELAEMTNRLEMLQSDFDDERTQRINFENELSNTIAEMDFKSDELESKTTALNQALKKVAELEGTTTSLEGEVTTLKTRMAESANVNNDSDSQDEIAKLTSERDELLSTVKSNVLFLRTNLEEAQSNAKNKQNKLDGVQRLLDDKTICLEAQLENNRKEKVEHEAVTEVYESKLAELIECKESMGQLSDQAITDSETITSLQGVINNLQTELADEAVEHQAQVRQVMSELSATHDRAQTSTTQFIKASAEIEKMREDIAGLKTVNTTLQTKAEQETDSSKTLLNEVTSLRKQAAEYAEVKQQLGTSHEAHINDINDLKTQLTDVSRVLEATEKIKSDKIEELNQLKIESADVKQKLTAAEEANQTREIEQQDSLTELTELRVRMEQMENDHAAITKAQQSNGIEMKTALEKLAAEKSTIETRYSMCEVNLDAALEDAEALVEELERAQSMEQTLYKEKEELKSKYEQSQEAKLSVEEDLAKLKHKLSDLQSEADKLVGHQNAGQKIQLFMQIKKENNTLKEEISKLQKVLPGSDIDDTDRRVLGAVNK